MPSTAITATFLGFDLKTSQLLKRFPRMHIFDISIIEPYDQAGEKKKKIRPVEERLHMGEKAGDGEGAVSNQSGEMSLWLLPPPPLIG